MGHTFAEKLLARNAGRTSVQPGQVIDATPDLVLSHDNTAAIIRTWRQLGLPRVKHPERLAIVLDHAAPAPTTQHAQNHAEIRRFVAEQGITHFFDVGRGICHQVLCEEGLIRAGMLVLGADSHSTHYGALGAFGAGIGRSEVAALWATGTLWLRVPESIKITLIGQLGEWISAKDVGLYIIGQLGADAGNYASLELHGETIAQLSMEDRFVLPNLMAEMGVKNAWLAPDQVSLAWLRAQTQNTDPHLVERFFAQAVYPDPDALYAAEFTFDVTALEPQIACPHAVDNVVPISKVAGTRVQQAFIGTCTNARLADLAVAARILQGRSVHPDTRLLVIPASARVLRAAAREGYLDALLAAGAIIGPPGCGPCMGNHLGVPAPGEVTISTANRNFRGRMGTREADIYLASPAVVAASAVTGRITHPAELE
ncbi:MAG: 3-isopropylmalate dehydratase large subunit [Anaerolineae bacterium]